MIAKKIKLGTKFIRAILCTRQNAIEIELIKLSIVVVMLAGKLCIRSTRAHMRIESLIKLNQEMEIVEYGQNKLDYKLNMS